VAEAHGVPNRRREVRDVFFEADHREHPAKPHGAEIVEGDGVLEEGGLRRAAWGGARRVVLDGVEDNARGLRGKVAVAQHPRGHRHGAPGVVGTLPHRVGAVQPDVMQECREAQYLLIVV
jgi:hypothetical protein